MPAVVTESERIYLDAGFDMEAQRRRFESELEKTKSERLRAEARLKDGAFRSRAPAHVVERTAARRAELLSKEKAIEEKLRAWFGK